MPPRPRTRARVVLKRYRCLCFHWHRDRSFKAHTCVCRRCDLPWP